MRKYILFLFLDSADWKKNYNFQMFTVNDSIQTFHTMATGFLLTVKAR